MCLCAQQSVLEDHQDHTALDSTKSGWGKYSYRVLRERKPLGLIIMVIRLTIHENEPPVEVHNVDEVYEVISSASAEARVKGVLNIIFIEIENGNRLSLVVGGDETVLSFIYGHLDPPYYASKGKDENDEPIMTAYAALSHHTEFPRKYVIPMSEGIRATQEFCKTGKLPSCIEWAEC